MSRRQALPHATVNLDGEPVSSRVAVIPAPLLSHRFALHRRRRGHVNIPSGCGIHRATWRTQSSTIAAKIRRPRPRSPWSDPLSTLSSAHGRDPASAHRRQQHGQRAITRAPPSGAHVGRLDAAARMFRVWPAGVTRSTAPSASRPSARSRPMLGSSADTPPWPVDEDQAPAQQAADLPYSTSNTSGFSADRDVPETLVPPPLAPQAMAGAISHSSRAMGRSSCAARGGDGPPRRSRSGYRYSTAESCCRWWDPSGITLIDGDVLGSWLDVKPRVPRTTGTADGRTNSPGVHNCYVFYRNFFRRDDLPATSCSPATAATPVSEFLKTSFRREHLCGNGRANSGPSHPAKRPGSGGHTQVADEPRERGRLAGGHGQARPRPIRAESIHRAGCRALSDLAWPLAAKPWR